MPTITYRANLSSAVFPMTLSDAGRTVINPQADQNFDRRVDPSGEQKDAGIPQAMYLENVLPTVSGYQSVGYTARTAIPPRSSGSGEVIFRRAFFVDNAIIIARDGAGSYKDVISNNIACSNAWQYSSGPIPFNTDTHSIAKVRGTNYWSDGTSLYSFVVDQSTLQVTFTDITSTVTGITVSDIKSICSAYNYLIALHVDGTIWWSSTTTPTDFVPSLVTGSGSQVPANAAGANFLVEHPAGFLIYCDNNVVSAKYTGNARYPWKFVTVADAGGYVDYNQVAGSSFSLAHYGIDNSNKLQTMDLEEARLVAPEVTTFLERKNYSDTFNYALNTFSKVTPLLSARIFYLLDRYLIVSLRYTEGFQYSRAIVYDKLLQRYGLVKVDHQYIFADSTTLVFIPTSPGAIPYTWSLDIYDTEATFNGVLLLGKFQFVRDRFLQLEEIALESAKDSIENQNLELLNFASLDGKNFLAPTSISTTAAGTLVEAKTHKTAKNHSIMLKGTFDVNTLELNFRIAGGR